MPHRSLFCSVWCVSMLVLAVVVGGPKKCEATELCYFHSGFRYCDYGCCTDSCCDRSTISVVWFVIGAVIALVTLVVCVFFLACMCIKRDANMVYPIQNTNSVYILNAASHPQTRNLQPRYGQYGQHGPYPGSTNPNYGLYDAGNLPGSHPPPAYTFR